MQSYIFDKIPELFVLVFRSGHMPRTEKNKNANTQHFQLIMDVYKFYSLAFHGDTLAQDTIRAVV